MKNFKKEWSKMLKKMNENVSKSQQKWIKMYNRPHNTPIYIKQINTYWLTLSVPALQNYVNCHSCVRLELHFSKSHFLQWPTIVLYRIAKENLSFCHKKWRVHYNSPLIMCYPLDQNIFYSPKLRNCYNSHTYIHFPNSSELIFYSGWHHIINLVN